jgi:predicted amidohydrolase YtcJ
MATECGGGGATGDAGGLSKGITTVQDAGASVATTQMEEIEEVGRLAVKHRLQLAVQVIGDRANRETLELFERIWREKGVDGPSFALADRARADGASR